MARRALATLAALAAVVGARPALAEELSITNVQLLYGIDFGDAYYGRATDGGRLTTVTLEHFGVWEHGDNFFFVDLLHGDFVGADGAPAGQEWRTYGEWTSRLSLSRITGAAGFLGVFRDVLLAGQLDVGGDGFVNGMAGVGLELALPEPFHAGVNVLYRDDRFNSPTFQVTAYWTVPFALGGASFVFTGFTDLAGTDRDGLDVQAQPQLLLDVGAFAGAAGRLHAGVEWYLHANEAVRDSAPQAMVRWTW